MGRPAIAGCANNEVVANDRVATAPQEGQAMASTPEEAGSPVGAQAIRALVLLKGVASVTGYLGKARLLPTPNTLRKSAVGRHAGVLARDSRSEPAVLTEVANVARDAGVEVATANTPEASNALDVEAGFLSRGRGRLA